MYTCINTCTYTYIYIYIYVHTHDYPHHFAHILLRQRLINRSFTHSPNKHDRIRLHHFSACFFFQIEKKIN